MHTMKKILVILLASCLLPLAAGAQDARQRTATTIVADALAQLPAQTSEVYNGLMRQLAATGAAGVREMAGMLVPADKGQNAVVEYALNGVTDYVTGEGLDAARAEVRKGLAEGIAACTDKPNQAFLLSLLQICSTEEDIPVFVKYADDDYLAAAAVRGLVSTPGSEEAVLSLMQNAPRPAALLAYAASKRPSEGAEEILLSWLTDYQTDATTKEAVYNALAACGGKSSLRTLADAAAASDYDFGKTDATSAYIRLVNRLADEGDTKSALAAARSLAKATARTNVRAAALQIILRTDVKKRTQNLRAALRDGDREYRGAALDFAGDFADEALYADMVKYGRRNIACLTIAPTGTTSLMTQTTSGIEPVFMPVYKRRRKVNPNDPEVRIDFVDESGDAFEEYIVYHHHFLTWMRANGIDTERRYTQEEIDELVARSPYYLATANDVDWLMKVKMQGEIQKWVDHSISVTVNLPNAVDEALVDRLYVEAWKSGCKGCTIYRDGSRAGVMVSVKKKKEDKGAKLQTLSPVVERRPEVLECDVVRFQNNKEKWVAFVGLLDGRPYEIFTGLQDDEEGIVLPKTVTKGRIVKHVNAEDGTKRYDFQFENKRGYKTTVEGLSEKFNKEYWNYAKLISGVLRYRMPLENVIKLVDSLQLESENINTWKVGVARALKKYITDGTEAKGLKCPNCGHEALVYQEGCLICKHCGSSRCG